MAMQTDVKATSISASGLVYEGRTRVKSVLIGPSGSAGNVTLVDGGANVFVIPTTASGETFAVLIPDQGVLFQTNVSAILVNATLTVFYG
jgi:hypothetical protein